MNADRAQSKRTTVEGRPPRQSGETREGSRQLVRISTPELDTSIDSGVNCAHAEQSRAYVRWVTSVRRAAFIGAGLRGGFALFGLLSKARTTPLRRADGVSAVFETARYVAFLSSFAGTYVGIDEVLACACGRQRSKHWRALVAGAMAGPTLLLTGREAHTSLAVYIFLRSVVLLARCGFKREHMPWLQVALSPLRYKHGDVALMCAASAQLLFAWIYAPQTLPATYIKFLNKQGGKNKAIVEALGMIGRATTLNQTRQGCQVAATHMQEMGLAVGSAATLMDERRTNLQHFHACIHPDQTCFEHFLSFHNLGFRRALPVYIPVYLLPALLVHRKKLLSLKGPLIALKVLLGAARSSVFLTAYCGTAWGGACTLQHIVKHARPWTVAAGASAAGLATLLEKKSRRMELAMYCLSRAAESFVTMLFLWGVLPRNWSKKWRRIDVPLFAMATATIMHCYNSERDVFKSKYLNVLDWVFGNIGHVDQRITHAPSSQQLTLRS